MAGEHQEGRQSQNRIKIICRQTGLTNSLCFTALAASTTLLTADLWRLQTLTYLAEKMHDPDDAQMVLSQIKDGSVARSMKSNRMGVLFLLS
jgi:hypothetical protein